MRAKLGIQRNSLLVELRMVNRIETELLQAEWQTWLFDEVSICSRLIQDFALLNNENGLYSNRDFIGNNGLLYSPEDARFVLEAGKNINNNKNKSPHHERNKKEEERLQFLHTVWKSPKEMRQFFSDYCLSCAKELGSVVGQSKKSSLV
ncbi:hypothetical protein D0Z03_001257 [Geotrichum reessii]|nr:hypothetical protein D0Z03_001257 [Galactomyces reessii]